MSMLDACDDKFKCYGGGSPSCIDWDKVCDGKPDCQNWEDERSCGKVFIDFKNGFYTIIILKTFK